MTHQEFDQLMNSYFDGKIEADDRVLLFAELERNQDRKKLFHRLSSIYEKSETDNVPQSDTLLSEAALSNKIKPSSKEDEILQKATSGSLLSGVNSDASRTWKGYTEDNYVGRIFAIFITAIIVVTLFVIDRQWAKSIEEKRKLGVLPAVDDVAEKAKIKPEIDYFEQIQHRNVERTDFTMGVNSQHFFTDDTGINLGVFKNPIGNLKADYLSRNNDLQKLTEQLSLETGTYIYNVQKNVYLSNSDVRTYSHTIILAI